MAGAQPILGSGRQNQKFQGETTKIGRQAFCLTEGWTQRMPFLSSDDLYSAREIALAAGVAEAQVAALLGGRDAAPSGAAAPSPPGGAGALLASAPA